MIPPELQSRILNVLGESRPMTAREIASNCETVPRDVAPLLHVELRDRLVRDAGFRWALSETPSTDGHSRRDAMLALNVVARSFVIDFLRRRGLEHPDGRELYAYRCTECEFEALHLAISDIVDFDPLGRYRPTFAPQFVLYAAEWWRRHQSGGVWAWEPVFESLDLRVGNILSIYPSVLEGLSFWHRRVLKSANGRMFLVTLACEGGLPLQVVKREGGRLREYFRHVLEDYGLYARSGVPSQELARRNAGYLPGSLRQEIVFELGGRLIEDIWQLQGRVRGAKDPIADLDIVEPKWRDQLPFEVDDDVANAFLNNLVRAAHQIREGSTEEFRFTRTLVSRGGLWSLRADLSFPPFVQAEWIAATTGIAAAELPSRGQFVLLSTRGEKRPIVNVTQRYRNGESVFQLERLGAVDSIEGAAATDGWTIGFESLHASGTRREIRGGTALSADIPWVFAEADEGRWRFLGQGSVRTRFSECVVLFPPLFGVDEGEALGVVGSRAVRLIDHSVDVVDSEGGRFRVLLGQAEELAAVVEIDGDRFPLAADERDVFLGIPTVRDVTTEDRPRSIQTSSIQWRPIGAREWRPWSRECLGRVVVRVVAGDETRFQQTIDILPNDFEVRLKGSSPTEGVIELITSEPVRMRDEFGESIRAEILQEAPSTVIRFRAESARRVPAAVSLRLEFGLDRVITVPVPFPAKGVRFVGATEKIFPYEATVTLDTLALSRIEVFAQPSSQRLTLESVLMANDVESSDHVATALDLPEARNGRIVLELRRSIPDIQGLLAQSDHPDAVVALHVDGFGPNKLYVRRYERQFFYSDDSSVVRICDVTTGELSTVEGDQIEAIRLWEPSLGRELLPAAEPGVWRTEKATRDPGPWLLVANVQHGAAVRPRLLSVDGTNRARGPLATAIASASRAEAEASIGTALRAMVEHPLDEEWAIVVATLRLATEVPPSTFLLTAALCSNEPAAVMALIHSGSDRQLIWDTLQQEGFEWCVVPIDTWVLTLQSYVHALEDQMRAASIPTDVAASEAESFVGFLEESAERSLMQPIWTILRWRVLLDSASALREGLGIAPEVAMPELQNARTQFLSRHADDRRWPQAKFVHNWLETSRHIPPIIRKLAGQTSFQRSAIAAPLLAAQAAVDGFPVDRRTRGDLRTQRRFDPEWFQSAYRLGTTMFLNQNITKEMLLL